MPSYPARVSRHRRAHGRALSASLFKTFTLTEKMRLRFQWDVFNPTNSPQQPQSPGNSLGLLYSYLSGTGARSMQFTLRLLW